MQRWLTSREGRQPSLDPLSCGDIGTEEARRAALLDRLLLFLIPLTVACGAFQWWARPSAKLHFMLVLAAAAIGVLAYVLNRIDCYRPAALIACLEPTVGSMVSLVVTPSEFIAFSYPVVGIIMAGMLLTQRSAILIALLNTAALLVLPLVQPAHTYPVVAAAIGFNLFMPILVVAGTSNRDQEERDRQELLRASEERWRMLVEHHPDPITLSVGGRYLFVNETCMELFGATRADQVVGHFIAEFTHPENFKQLRGRINQVARGERTMPLPFRVIGLDGRERRVEASSVPVAHGEETAALTVMRDVTDQWLAERNLKHSEERFRAIVEHAPEAIVVIDLATGRFVDCNSNAERLFGLDAAGMAETGPVARSPKQQPDGAESAVAWKRQVTRAMAGIHGAFEWTFIGADGELPCEARLVRLPSVEGLLVRGSLTDVTERKRLEKERMLAQAKIRSVVENASDVITVLDAQGRIVFESPSVRRMLGYSPDELMGRDVTEFIHEDDVPAVTSALREGARNPGVPHSLELRLRHVTGTWRIVEAVGKVLPEALDDWQVVVHSRDITERRRLERELLVISNREQRRFGQDLHDGMGQVLVGARLYAAGLEKRLQQKHPAEADGVREIGRMLDEAHAQARALARGLSPVSLEGGGFLSALEDLANGVSRMYGVLCTVEAPDSITLDDLDAATHLYRIAQEAATNAARHGRPDQIVLTVNQSPEAFTLQVRDDGTGLAPDERNGGMGIPIMRRRAAMLHGSLEVTSTPYGTAVTCAFPTDPAPSLKLPSFES